MPRLENWSIVCNNNPYQAPETKSSFLYGTIFDDEKRRFSDGVDIQTSTLCELDIKRNYARTRNTEYTLGQPSDDWLHWLNENQFNIDDYKI